MNLLGAVGLAAADRIEAVASEVMSRSGETPAAVIVIGYDLGPSNDALRRILGLSHPGAVRLVDRLVADGLVERRQGKDKRAVALFLTDAGYVLRERLLEGRLAAVGSMLAGLTHAEQDTMAALLEKVLASMEATDLQRCSICRWCDASVCENCPIPANFRHQV